ncbi:MAG TPA: hypothetical protein P5205_00205 [Candidatus Paceibacterota bacterium]|nr:hypothetical protein [Candidatus Paceibacterota bacterium]
MNRATCSLFPLLATLALTAPAAPPVCELYAVGPLRHFRNRRFIEMPWYRSWATQKPPPPPQPDP